MAGIGSGKATFIELGWGCTRKAEPRAVTEDLKVRSQCSEGKEKRFVIFKRP